MRSTRRWAISLVMTCWAVLPCPAMAQIQDGRALDANFQVGQSTENPEAYQFIPTPADLIISGNVTGGRAFQGYSPIRNPYAFRAGVPSSSLSNFRRDSFGLSSYGLGGYSIEPVPYFAPESHAIGTARSLLGPITSAPDLGSSSFTLRRSDLGAVAPVPLDIYDARILAPGAAPTASDTPYAITLPELNIPPSLPNAPGRSGDSLNLTPGFVPVPPASDGLRLQLEDLLGRSREAVSPTLPLESTWAAGGAALPSESAAAETAVPVPAAGTVTEQAVHHAAVELGALADALSPDALPASTGDPFQDFQLALNWLNEHQPAGSTGATESPSPEEPQAADLFNRAVRMVERSAESFAGNRPNLAADYIRQAEELLKGGEFTRAAGMYRLAATLEPDNPLIDLGLGHAQLGAGEFRSAFLSLTRGIERFPGFEYFNLDLSVFLTDATLLDRRRSQLESALSAGEDYQLRFLLGYAEYFSGLQKFGMEDFNKASPSAPADSIVRKVPDLLARQPYWKR